MVKTAKFVGALCIAAIVGGIIVLILTKAFHKLFSDAMSGMMTKMCEKMKREGKNPMDMCKKMMEGSTCT
jgi:hypothetical protein